MDFEARLAAGHLCAMGVGAWPHLQGLIDAALGPQQAQAVLLIGMQAAALQVSLHGTVSCAKTALKQSVVHRFSCKILIEAICKVFGIESSCLIPMLGVTYKCPLSHRYANGMVVSLAG